MTAEKDRVNGDYRRRFAAPHARPSTRHVDALVAATRNRIAELHLFLDEQDVIVQAEQLCRDAAR